MEASNVKAMREALAEATEILIRIVGCDHYTFHRNKHHCDFKTTIGECRNKNICETVFKAQAALAAPPRQCDVGTAEEQDKRFAYQFCRVGIEGCVRCKLNTLKHRGNTCGIHWAQMPYKEGDAE